MINIINKFKLILSKHQKMRVLELLILMIFGGLLETFSISLILPFMEAISNPKKIMSRWYIRSFCDFSGIQSPNTFIILLAVLLVFLYLFKNLYLVLENNIQYRFVYGNMANIQCRLLEVLINRPYEYFLSINTGELIKIINSDPREAFTLLILLLSMFTEIIVSSMILLVTFIMAPTITIIILLLLSIILLFINVFIKPIISKASLNLQQSSINMNKWLLQAINGIKELKVLNKEDFFLKNYEISDRSFVSSLRKSQILQIMPRYIIEAVCMSVLFLIVTIMIILGIQLETIVPVFTTIAMATIRLLPSMNRISLSLTQIAYGEPILDKMIKHITTINASQPQQNQNVSNLGTLKNSNIHLSDITFAYPKGTRNILDHAFLDILAGETIGIVGASGAGKTTLADIILGLLTPREGNFFIGNYDITANIAMLHSLISYIPQSIFMLDATIAANIAFGISEKDISYEILNRVIKEAALDSFINELPDGLQTQIGERGLRISGGQRQRIGIARALYREPKILIFDEATSALDNKTEETIMESIKHLKGKKTIIIIAHRLSTIEGCDHVYRVENGKIIKER